VKRPKRFIRNMAAAVRDMEGFDWFYLSFFVFASTLFWAVVAELQKEIQG
jgi:hypothetical protein